MTNITTLAEKIAKLEKELEENKKLLETEKKLLASLTLEERVADMFHSKFCRSDHTDQCGWEYSNWDKYKRDLRRNDHTRRHYLEKADNLIKALRKYNIPEEALLDILAVF